MKSQNLSACPESSRANPVKAIRLKCLDCSGGSSSEVDNCNISDCALWPFRKGKNPFRTRRELSEEQKEAIRKRLEQARLTRADAGTAKDATSAVQP